MIAGIKNLFRMNIIGLSMCCILNSFAEEAKSLSPRYVMALVYVVDQHDMPYLFTINNSVAFKTLEGLKKFFKSLPEGSTISWSMGCMRHGNEPLVNSDAEMNDFKAFCESLNLRLEIIPSG